MAHLTRRAWLKAGAALAAIDLTGCGSGSSAAGSGGGGATGAGGSAGAAGAGGSAGAAGAGGGAGGVSGSDALVGLYPTGDAVAAVRAACARIDFGWLSEGDTVLVKLAANSDLSHPSVTSPNAVRGLVAELLARGAGRVLVGDQCGVEFVRNLADGTRFSSTRERLTTNGLVAAIEESGAETAFFDDRPWDTGWFQATPPAGTRWERPLWMPAVLQEVDHVVYAPRLAAHGLAGYTHAHKVAVGWLREDSKHHLHHAFDGFYEKFVDINYVAELRDKVRLALSLSERMLLHFGPDTGTDHVMDPLLVIAAPTLTAHDAVSSAVLDHLNGVVGAGPGTRYSALTVDLFNRLFKDQVVPDRTGLPWVASDSGAYRSLTAHAFEGGISSDRALGRAFELAGGRPTRIAVHQDGAALDAELRAAIEAHGEGTVVFV